jgi:hypothetical protein
MAERTWDAAGERLYETGVSKGVLFVEDGTGGWEDGVAWNGLTAITESPSGAETSPLYADNMKYLSLTSAEEFAATVEAYMYPDEFAQCDGSAELSLGVTVGQQARKKFALVYRSELGNDTEGTEHGYKIHIIYGAQAAPSERAFASVNDSPEAITLSWELTTTPVAVTGLKPTAIVTIDSTKILAADLAAIEDSLYGTLAGAPTLLTPDALKALIDSTT